jgi:hypothetical protein
MDNKELLNACDRLFTINFATFLKISCQYLTEIASIFISPLFLPDSSLLGVVLGVVSGVVLDVLSSLSGRSRKLDMLSFEVTSVSLTKRNSCEQIKLLVKIKSYI